jgi:DNA polymerase (family 10)
MQIRENSKVAVIFHEMADMLDILGENPFRIRAFRRAAQAIENLPESVGAMAEKGTLTKVPGIGSGIAGRIDQILESGDCEDHATLRKEIGDGLLEMMRIEGVGPKTVKLVYNELNLQTVDQLEGAARDGHLARLPRMGEKSQAKILDAIAAYRRHSGRVLLGEALPQGMAIVEALKEHPAVERIDLAGSSRRRRETIGDLDVLVGSDDSTAVMDRFVTLDVVHDVMLRGDTKCSVHLESGLQVDLRVVRPESFGAALHYFTGSKMHNIAIRDRGKRQGLRINEYGIYREDSQDSLGGATEEEIFEAVGLPWIPPEIRENQGEIEAAETDQLPELIEDGDLLGDLHIHTDFTDGTASVSEMAEAAAALGMDYIAITDHSKALTVARGLDEERLAEQIKLVRQAEDEVGEIRILTGIEVDIMPDGRLDLEVEALAELDWVVASVHSHFNLTEDEQTARIIKAMETGVVDCIGHPSGRLLGQRDPYLTSLDRVIQAAARLGVALELNAFPDRLDLDAIHCRQAREVGVPVVISTDAHAPAHLAQRQFGIYTARRGWLEPEHVLNTRPIEDLEAWIKARRPSKRKKTKRKAR